jgi:outer membrane protein TolC
VIATLTRRLAALIVLAFATVPQVRAQGAAAAVPDTPLTLGDAARLAARQSNLVEGARQRAEQAGARVVQRRSELLPNVSGIAAANGRTFNTATLGIDLPTAPGSPPIFDPDGQVEGPVNTLDFRGRVSQTVLDLSALSRVRSARAAADAADAGVSDASEQAATIAATAYVRYLRAAADVAARGADSTLADSLLLIAREQLRAGVGVGLDVTRAQSQLAGVRAQLIVSRNTRDRARLDLLRALNLPADAPVRLADSLATLPIGDALPDEAQAVERALRERPDLRAAEAQLRAAERQVGAIRAERLPSVGVFADAGAIGKSADHLLGTYTWGLQLSLPVFDGFRRGGRVAEQQAVVREIDARRGDLRLQAVTEVRAALLDLASAREQVDAARERLRLAEQEVSQAQERFRAGVAGNADVITASLALTGARTLVVDALTSYQAARVALARAEGEVTALP